MIKAAIIGLGRWGKGLVTSAHANPAKRIRFVHGVSKEPEDVRDFAWWSLGGLLIIVLDAYVDAQLYDFNEDPVPVPPLIEPVSPPALSQASSGPPAGTVLFRWQTAF